MDNYPESVLEGNPQFRNSTFYDKIPWLDSELGIDKSSKSQINLLRVVVYENYPTVFISGDRKYILKIVREK